MTRLLTRVLTPTAIASVLLVAEPALAQQSGAVMSEALFQEGKRLMNEGKFAEGCPKLAESQRLDPGAGTLTALALCHKSQGKTASAWGEFKEVVSLARRDGRKDREQVAQDAIAELEPKLARLKIDVSGGALAQNVEVRLDDTAIQRAGFGQSFPADPGTHKVQARAAGKKTFEALVVIEGDRDDKTVTVPALGDDPLASTPATAPAAAKGSEGDGAGTRRTVGYVIAGAGALGLIAGGIFGIRAISKEGESDDACGSPCASPAGLAANDDARSAATISNILFGVGAVALIGGVVLVLTAPSASKTSTSAGTARRILSGTF